MPLTDPFTLPRLVREMEQMGDLLQAEQLELDRISQLIALLEKQLTISTADFLLPRHEQIYGMATNPEESLDVRRARLLARLNARGATTVASVQDLAKIVTGCSSEILEYPAEYLFRVVFPIDVPNLLEFRRALDERKPAHLLYIIRRTMHTSGQNRNELDFVRLVIRWRASNWGRLLISFDGEKAFDGEICWDQQVMPQNTSRIRIRIAARNENRIKPRLFFFSSFQNQNDISVRSSVHFQMKNENAVQSPKIKIYTREKNRQSSSAWAVFNPGFFFDGDEAFDGGKRFNSGVTEEM